MSKKDNRIYVTQPSLPPLNKFVEYLEDIWESRRITNKAKYHREFEIALAEYLGVKYISLYANGTLALMAAIHVLGIKGEVITTPYSFVATTHALWWNGISPVFVDIEDEYCNINPEKIEAAITPKTTAILAVHVYGNPCNIKRIQEIADKHGLKVIYDAAHAFNVRENENPILNFGDLSILSFHATKPFNTIEGGAIICRDESIKKRIDYIRNFGFEDEVTVVTPGINAKMNELQAAYGLLQLKSIEQQISQRKKNTDTYRELLSNVRGISFINDIENIKHNYAYFPIFVDSSKYSLSRDELYIKLKENNIYCRRYFYPLISEFPVYKRQNSAKTENLPVATKISKQVICLPIYPDLEIKTITKIVELII